VGNDEALTSIAGSLDRLSRVAVLRLIDGRDRPEQAWLLDALGFKQGEIAELLNITQSGVSKAITRFKQHRHDSSD
jgi:DNA-binding MarR family transcriptional regulator